MSNASNGREEYSPVRGNEIIIVKNLDYTEQENNEKIDEYPVDLIDLGRSVIGCCQIDQIGRGEGTNLHLCPVDQISRGGELNHDDELWTL